MQLGLLTVPYHDLSRTQALDRVRDLGLDAVELATGNFPGDAHCPATALVDDVDERRRLVAELSERRLAISALSQHGNPLHPDRRLADAAHRTWRSTLQLAEQLEVPVVNGFSGCPGSGDDARTPNWITCAWPLEFLEVLDWQWNECVLPYWAREADVARRHGVTIGFEMHPGMVVYNPATLLRLRDACGPAIAANLDPSHLFWQGIDPVSAIEVLAATGAVAHVHVKDVWINRERTRVNGVLDTQPYGEVARRSWLFRTIGYGHGESVWREILTALRLHGYDGVLSIEHEDDLMSIDEGISKAAAFLRGIVTGREAPT